MIPTMPIQPRCVLRLKSSHSKQGIRVMVIGDIGELGASAAQQHYKLGRDLVSSQRHQLCGGSR